MNSPQPHPATERHVAGLVALEADLDHVAQDLTRVRDRVVATRRAWAAELTPQPAAGSSPGPAPDGPPSAPAPAPASPLISPVLVTARPPWWQREGAVARVLSAVGAGVLLIGVSFLLVLAVQNGYFGPVPRVVAGSVVALALLTIGAVVHRRQPGNAGAVALAGCGVAGGYLDVVAVSTIYAWVPPWLGLLLAAAVFAVGLVLSRRWASQVLAVIVVLGVVVLAPAVGGDRLWLPTAFLVLVSAGALLVDLDRNWPVLQVARVAPTALVLASAPLTYGGDSDMTARLIDAVLVTGFAALMLAGHLWASGHGRRGTVWTTMLGVAGLPVLVVVPEATDSSTTTVWLLALAAGWAVTGLLVGGAGPRAVLTSLAALAVLVSLIELEREDLLVPGLLVVAVSYLALGVRHRVVGWVGVGVAAGGLVSYLPLVAPLLDETTGRPFQVGDVAAGALLVAAAVLASHLIARDVGTRSQGWGARCWRVGCWTAGLLGVTGTTVSAGVLVGERLGNAGTGFVAGHAVATLVWLAAAAWLLVRSLKLRSRRHLSAGMVLAGLAVAKLMVFDLSTLDGVVRVAAFLLAGAALLTLGTLYARSMRNRPVSG